MDDRIKIIFGDRTKHLLVFETDLAGCGCAILDGDIVLKKPRLPKIGKSTKTINVPGESNQKLRLEIGLSFLGDEYVYKAWLNNAPLDLSTESCGDSRFNVDRGYSIDDFKLCDKCHKLLAVNVKYCGKCGNHGFVDIEQYRQTTFRNSLTWTLIVVHGIIWLFLPPGNIVCAGLAWYYTYKFLISRKENKFLAGIMREISLIKKEKTSRISVTTENHFTKAYDHLRSGDFSSAVTNFEASMDNGISTDDMLIAYAVACYNAKNYQKCINVLEPIEQEVSKRTQGAAELLTRCYVRIDQPCDILRIRLKNWWESDKDSMPDDIKKKYFDILKNDEIRNEESIDVFKHFTDMANSDETTLMMAQSLFNTGDYENASTKLIGLLKSKYDLKNTIPLYTLCLAHLRDGSPNARVFMEKALTIKPDIIKSSEFVKHLSSIYIKNNDFDKALALYERKLLSDNSDIESKYQRTLLLIKLKRINDAIKELQEIQKSRSEIISQAQVTKLLGKCLKSKKLYALALQEFKKLKADPSLMELVYSTGHEAENAGEMEIAINCYGFILVHDISFKDVADKIDRLKSHS